MAISSKNKVDPAFSMSSMTDIIFLLLIFFLLTSNFVTPSGLPINVPTSKQANKVLPKINVGVTKDGLYYVNEIRVPFNRLEQELKVLLGGQNEGVVVLNIDKSVPVQTLVDVASIAAKLNAKVAISTKPD
jgi:biopolymer transport protein ExbD